MGERRSAHFEFVPGCLCIRKSGYADRDGSGYLQFNEDDVDIHQHDEPEGNYMRISLDKSELVALRDFLMQEFPPLPRTPNERD